MHIEYERLERAYVLPLDKRRALAEQVRIKAEADVKSLTNQQLLEAYTELHAGDDWDGNLTPGGSQVLDVLCDELYYRLRECGFLPKEDN